MEPLRQHHEAFHVAGPSVRTTNRDESDAATARISALWGGFFAPHTGNAPIFGVYSAYESDANGAFDVTAGIEVSGPGTVAIETGDYLVFSAQGDMPQAVIATWQRIWHYFERRPEVVRRYRTDFESYGGPDKVDIHIGVM